MSKETKNALETAIANHFSDEMEGSLLTDYVLTATGVSAKQAGQTGYMHEASLSPPHVTYGLAGMGMDYFSSDDEDDEE